MSERFRLPDEALPSEPPPPLSPPPAPLGGGDETPAVGTATAHIPLPEKIKLLNAALPTPQSFEPVQLSVPKDAPLPRMMIDLEMSDAGERAGDDTPLEAPATSERSAARLVEHRPARRQAVNALALFVVLLGVSALAIGLCGDFLFQ